jgi:hypothetical protein
VVRSDCWLDSANGSAALTGGAWVTGGSKATGGATATGDGGTNPEVDGDVQRRLHAARQPQSATHLCPADCVGTCNKTFAQLAGANTCVRMPTSRFSNAGSLDLQVNGNASRSRRYFRD